MDTRDDKISTETKGVTENIKVTWNTEESKVGKFLIKWVCFLGIFCSAIGGGLEWLGAIPGDWIPNYLKTIIVICALVGGLIGKLTKKINVKQE